MEDEPQTSAVDALFFEGLDKSADAGSTTQKTSKVGLTQTAVAFGCEDFRSGILGLGHRSRLTTRKKLSLFEEEGLLQAVYDSWFRFNVGLGVRI